MKKERYEKPKSGQSVVAKNSLFLMLEPPGPMIASFGSNIVIARHTKLEEKFLKEEDL